MAQITFAPIIQKLCSVYLFAVFVYRNGTVKIFTFFSVGGFGVGNRSIVGKVRQADVFRGDYDRARRGIYSSAQPMGTGAASGTIQEVI